MSNTDSYIIDTHAHLYLNQFDKDRAQVIKRALDADIRKIFLPNIDLSTIESMHQMEVDFPEVCYSMMGLHPCSVKPDYKKVLSEMEKNLDKRNYIGIGETGIDLFWDKTYQKEQEESFRRHLEWGRDKNLPVVIHSRDSLALNIKIVKEMQDGRLSAVFHCFNGTVDQANEIADLNCYLGLGGVFTFKNAGLKEITKYLPFEKIVLETDAPYLTPSPHRGKRNESAYTLLVANVLSTELGMSIEAVMKFTTKNALALFSSVT